MFCVCILVVLFQWNLHLCVHKRVRASRTRIVHEVTLTVNCNLICASIVFTTAVVIADVLLQFSMLLKLFLYLSLSLSLQLVNINNIQDFICFQGFLFLSIAVCFWNLHTYLLSLNAHRKDQPRSLPDSRFFDWNHAELWKNCSKNTYEMKRIVRVRVLKLQTITLQIFEKKLFL